MIRRILLPRPVAFAFRCLLCCLACWLPAPGIRAAEARPNVVLIIADDMAWDDCGAYGNAAIPTPNLDALAADGMKFEHAFLTISSCSPSRASIITGRYPHNTDAEELHWPLPAEQVTFVELLKKAGYWTGAAGKWHLGDEIRDRFDEIRETDTSGFQLPTGAKGQEGKFVETLEGEAQSGCAEWLPLMRARDKSKPFFLWLAALDPHRDYHEGILPEPTDPASVVLPPYHPDTPEVRKDYAMYYDEIIRLDKYVGMVRKELRAQEVEDNTVLIFISDNGRPFPRDKTTLYDSGIRTPLLVSWPAEIAPGQKARGLVSTVDLAPTILELAGVSSSPTFEGRSFAKVLRDPEASVRDYVFAEKNWHDFEDHARAVRNLRFKYIRNYYHDLPLTPPADAVRSPTYEEMLRLKGTEGGLTEAQAVCFRQPRPAEELYDVNRDPFELHNLAGDTTHHETLEEMREELAKWEKETGDYAPDLRTADEFDRVTGVPTPARVRPRRSKAEMVKDGLVAP